MKPVFSKAARVVLIVVAALSTVATLFWFFFGHELSVVRSAANDSFSLSALGHHGFKEIIEHEGYTVHVSRNATALKAQSAGLLVLAEPRIDPDDEDQVDELRELLNASNRTLLILPKRRGIVDARNPAWIESVTPVEHDYARTVLNLALPSANLERHDEVTWRESQYAPPRLNEPQLIYEVELGRPLIDSESGEFLVEVTYQDGAMMWVMSDPDLIANHGLDEPGNIELIRTLLGEMVSAGGGVVIDETFHGHEASPSMGKLLTEFPLVVTTVQALLVLLLLAWALLLRMGSTRKADFAMERGKTLMLRNTAELLRFGKHDASATEKYVMYALDDVAERLRAPAHLAGMEKARWLDERAEEKGVTPMAHRLYSQAQRATIDRREFNARQLLAMARATQQWKTEMLDGA